jgi:hypothetical protein
MPHCIIGASIVLTSSMAFLSREIQMGKKVLFRIVSQPENTVTNEDNYFPVLRNYLLL